MIELKYVKTSGGVVVYQIHCKELDMFQKTPFAKESSRVLSSFTPEVRKVHLNGSEMNFIDTDGMDSLLELCTDLAIVGLNLSVFLPDTLARYCRLAGLDREMEIVPIPDAVAS